MKPTKDRAFLDTNVLVYLYTSKDSVRESKVLSIFSEYAPVVSTQILQELSNILIKKYNQSIDQVAATIDTCLDACELHTNTCTTIKQALNIRGRYHFSFYDSLVVAAAQESNCTILFSEDLQHQQQCDKITVVNPFLIPNS